MFRILFISGLLVLFGCQSINNRGEYVPKETLLAIEKNHISKEQLLEMLGEPTIIPDYSTGTWYYVSRKVQDKVWSRPSIKSQRVVKITFNGDNVDKIEILDKRPKNNVNIDPEITPVKGTEESAIQTFVKNFGRFNKTARKKRRE